MLEFWRWLVHQSGSDYGAPYGHWVPYSFWSGVAGSFLIAVVSWLLIGLPLWYLQHTCHDHLMCLRWGKHPAAGGTFKLCWKHHPDMGTRPHRDMIHRLHREWKQQQA